MADIDPDAANPVFTDTEVAYLRSRHLGRLATQKPDGTLQNNPVGFTLDAGAGTITIVGYDLDRSRKYRNVADNGRVAFVVDDLASVDPWRVRCVEIRGRAEATTGDGDDPPRIRIHPTRVISFGVDEPDTAARRLVVDARDVAVAPEAGEPR